METLNFRTNIKNSADIEAVTVNLNSIEQVDGWNIDINNQDNLLTVQTTDNRIADLVSQAVRQAGYEANLLAEPS